MIFNLISLHKNDEKSLKCITSCSTEQSNKRPRLQTTAQKSGAQVAVSNDTNSQSIAHTRGARQTTPGNTEGAANQGSVTTHRDGNIL